MNALSPSHLCCPISIFNLQPGSLVSLWAPAWWSLVLVIPFAILKALEMLSGPVRAPQSVFPWELLWALWCPWVGLWGAADQTDVGPFLSCPTLPDIKRGESPTGNHWHSFSKLGFLIQFSEISNVYGGNSLLEVLKASKNCTVKLIKPLKKHSNSTKVSCCTTSLLEEAVCIFKSVCKSFKSVLLQPQRVLQCSQKNCKEEIVNPWYSA